MLTDIQDLLAGAQGLTSAASVCTIASPRCLLTTRDNRHKAWDTLTKEAKRNQSGGESLNSENKL